MSNYQAIGGSFEPVRVKITTTAVITVVAADKAIALVSLSITNLTTNLPTLTVAIYDGTSRYYLRNAVAMATKERVEFTLGYPLNKGESVEVTISADSVDVVGTVIPKP